GVRAPGGPPHVVTGDGAVGGYATGEPAHREGRAGPALHSGFGAGQRMRRASSATPTLMAESATLNAGQWYPRQWKSRKSTTAPNRPRSMRLPTAPPKMNPRASRVI